MKDRSRQPRTFSRRQFLRGAGGAFLAIPFLPSLASRAQAAPVADYNPHRCFLALSTDHGGVWAKNMYPEASVLSAQTAYAGRSVRYGALPGSSALSPVCTASALTPALASKFNILRGLDIPYRISHHQGGHLGNFAQTTGRVLGGLDSSAHLTATIDQFAAWSPSFYDAADLESRMTTRSFQVGHGWMSWNFASPSTKTGDVVKQPTYTSNQALFKLFFDPGSTYNGVDTFIIDRVKSSYDRLRKHPRLTHGDRMRLDQHVERMFEIERKLAVAAQWESIPDAPAVGTETGGDFGSNPAANIEYCSLMIDVIVAAFSAGVSRIGTWQNAIKFTDSLINDWHGQVAHGGFGATNAQAWALTWNQGTFEHIMVQLAARMDDVDMGDGTTLLDNSLVLFTQEAGQQTHHTGVMSYPVVTAGSAGGYFNTGLYVDYSNPDVTYDDLAELVAAEPLMELERPGLYYNQFLATVLQSLGIGPSEFEGFRDFTSGEPTPGYGLHYIEPEREPDYALAKNAMSDPLPVITQTRG